MSAQSQLGRLQAVEPMPDDELRAYARRALHERDIAVIWLDEVNDDWTRQVIINEAEKAHGKRRKAG